MKHTHETAHMTFPVEVYDIFRRTAKENKLSIREYFYQLLEYGLYFHTWINTTGNQVILMTKEGKGLEITSQFIADHPLLQVQPKEATK